MESTTRECLGPGRIKGGILRAHLDWARQRLGADWLEALDPHLTRTDRELLAGRVLASEWIPFATLIEIDRAIVAAAGGRLQDVCRELGRFSAQQNLTTVYKAFSQSDPQAFFRREALLHDQYLDFGRVIHVEQGPQACRIELHDHTCYSRVFCLSAAGYYQRAVELQGGLQARIDERECRCLGAAACVFEIAWQPAGQD